MRAFRDSEPSGGDRIEAFLFVPQLSSLGCWSSGWSACG